jgi:hypothetical protein
VPKSETNLKLKRWMSLLAMLMPRLLEPGLNCGIRFISLNLLRLTSKKSDCYVPGAQGGHCAATIVLIVTDAIVPIVVMIV